MKKAIQIDGKDNVATVTSGVKPGESVEVISPRGEVVTGFPASDKVPYCHKIAIANLEAGDHVVKYGEVIGVASKPVKSGEWVHTHNVESAAVPTSGYGGKDR